MLPLAIALAAALLAELAMSMWTLKRISSLGDSLSADKAQVADLQSRLRDANAYEVALRADLEKQRNDTNGWREQCINAWGALGVSDPHYRDRIRNELLKSPLVSGSAVGTADPIRVPSGPPASSR